MARFKKVYIETTNICNLSCKFCPKTKRKLKFMSEEEFEYIIKSIKPFTNYVYFHLMGEPCLNRNIKKFLDISYREGLMVNITTNGTLLENVKDILISSKSLRQVNISLHSYEANDNKETFRDYINKIINFIKEANEKSNIICSLRLWNMDTEELKANNSLNNEILDIIEKELNVDFALKDKLIEKKGIKIRKNLYLNMAEKFKWPDINLEKEETKIFCYGLRDQIGILVDGTVVPCCLDSEGNIALGNIFDVAFEKIITSDRANKIYDGFSNRIAMEDLCKKCGYAKRY